MEVEHVRLLIEGKEVTASVLRSASYDSETKTLTVELANGQRVEPDYQAAKLAAFDMDEQIAMERSRGQRFSLTEVNDMKVRAAVDAAIGDRLLVDYPKEAENE